tara:strand:- start:749 stop:976 length:228 start_codon:yes stop_codon:yes gene_type:complete
MNNAHNHLQITHVRYFETRRGLGYECKTNIEGIKVWNDGMGGDTYIEPCKKAREMNLYDISEFDLEKLIDKYESA